MHLFTINDLAVNADPPHVRTVTSIDARRQQILHYRSSTRITPSERDGDGPKATFKFSLEEAIRCRLFLALTDAGYDDRFLSRAAHCMLAHPYYNVRETFHWRPPSLCEILQQIADGKDWIWRLEPLQRPRSKEFQVSGNLIIESDPPPPVSDNAKRLIAASRALTGLEPKTVLTIPVYSLLAHLAKFLPTDSVE